ncbi:MAG: TIGR04283 family arsenosugar biosynthesis glycosyltransferase [Synergistaceae bacterium]|nr:TIGR04283 family arsenosugar biosynthesis glycosyltransferase [Synergistaceae bacterium]
MISIIVPVLNEENNIAQLISSLQGLEGDKEIIISDGGSEDSTRELAEKFNVTVINSKPGRAFQMNAGANIARGQVLWFVHADSRVSSTSLHDINDAINNGAAGGFFKLRFYDSDSDDKFMNFIARTSHTRAKNFCLIFGDQGLFLRRDIFNELGGFTEIYLMEDWEISRRLRKLHKAGKIFALDTIINTSARRYITHGKYKTWLKMNIVKALYILGCPTKFLRSIYER